MRTIAPVASLLLLAVAFLPVRGDAGPDLFSHNPGIWQIEGTPGQRRWLIIHNLAEARATGIFHIEIIGRRNGQPAWSIVHICDHMAITQAALERSVIRPLDNGAVYPENFEAALARWKKEADQGRQRICTTSVSDCLQEK